MFFRKVRTWLLAGIVVLLPIWLTIFAVLWLFDYVDRTVAAPIINYTGLTLPGIGLLILFLLFLLVGWLTTHLLGQEMIRFGERLMNRIPVVKGLYPAVKQMTEAVLNPRDQSFSRVVLVEYPRRGVFSMGFATGELPGTQLIRVWIPPGPSPTAGPIVLFPVDEVVGLPISVEDGFKVIVSAGAFTPGPSDVAAIEAAVAQLQGRADH